MGSAASREFARLLDDQAPATEFTGRLAVGLEAEYIVRDRHGVQVDFRDLIGGIGVGPAGLDPGDVHARRLASSSAVTCDFREAELALRKEPLQPGFAGRVSARLAADEAALAQSLAPNFTLHGYTTHVSISVARHLVEQVAWVYAETFGPATMLMMDGCSSPGFLVRPRAGGRIELCGWYLEPGVRQGALVFAAGSVLACVRAVEAGDFSELPPSIVGNIEPGASRHGWYLDRRAFGPDLYSSRRLGVIRRRDGDAVTAQEHLGSCWDSAHAALGARATEAEVRAAEVMVLGESSLACELPGVLTPIRADRQAASPAASDLARPRRRGAFDLAAIALTWDFAVFVIANAARSRRAYAVVPADKLQVFIEMLDAGKLDEVMTGYLRARAASRVLAEPEQTEEAGLFSELADRVGLLRPETEPTGTFTV